MWKSEENFFYATKDFPRPEGVRERKISEDHHVPPKDFFFYNFFSMKAVNAIKCDQTMAWRNSQQRGILRNQNSIAPTLLEGGKCGLSLCSFCSAREEKGP